MFWDELHPHICDTRDFLPEIFGTTWTHKNRLMEIVASLPILEKKLKKMNDNRLSMQNIGHFNGNDLFSEE